MNNGIGLSGNSVVTLGSGSTSGVLELGNTFNAGVNTAIGGLFASGTGTGNEVINGTGNGSASNLTLNIAGTDTFTGVIGGTATQQNAVSLIKNGTGNFTLSGGASTYTGTTTVNAGTFGLANGASLGGTAITVGTGTAGGAALFQVSGNSTIGTGGTPSLNVKAGTAPSTLSMVDGTSNVLTINSATSGATVLTLGGSSGAISLNMDVGATSDEIILGSGLLASVGSGGVIVNINGLGTLNGTTQTLISAPGGGLPTGTFTLGHPHRHLCTGYNLALVDSSTSLQLTETLAATGSAFYTGAGGSVWSTGAGANFNTTFGGATALTAAPGGAVTNVFIAASSATGTSTTLGQNTDINSLSFTGAGAASTTPFTLAADGSTLTLAAANSSFTDQEQHHLCGRNGHLVQSRTDRRPTAIAVPVLLGSSQTWEIDNAATTGLTVSGSIGDGGLGFSLTKTGTGSLILSGAETYTGATYVQNGTARSSRAPGGNSTLASRG